MQLFCSVNRSAACFKPLNKMTQAHRLAQIRKRNVNKLFLKGDLSVLPDVLALRRIEDFITDKKLKRFLENKKINPDTGLPVISLDARSKIIHDLIEKHPHYRARLLAAGRAAFHDADDKGRKEITALFNGLGNLLGITDFERDGHEQIAFMALYAYAEAEDFGGLANCLYGRRNDPYYNAAYARLQEEHKNEWHLTFSKNTYSDGAFRVAAVVFFKDPRGPRLYVGCQKNGMPSQLIAVKQPHNHSDILKLYRGIKHVAESDSLFALAAAAELQRIERVIKRKYPTILQDGASMNEPLRPLAAASGGVVSPIRGILYAPSV